MFAGMKAVAKLATRVNVFERERARERDRHADGTEDQPRLGGHAGEGDEDWRWSAPRDARRCRARAPPAAGRRPPRTAALARRDAGARRAIAPRERREQVRIAPDEDERERRGDRAGADRERRGRSSATPATAAGSRAPRTDPMPMMIVVPIM
jgi:hypothetical protein